MTRHADDGRQRAPMTEPRPAEGAPTEPATQAPQASVAEHAQHSRVDKLCEKAKQEKTVRGHAMPAANIFKLAGLAAFFVIMIVVIIIVWPYVHQVFEPGGLEEVMAKVRSAGPAGILLLLAIQFLQIVVAFIPGEVVQVAAGILYGPWLGAAVVILGCVISSAFVYLLVSKLGAPFVRSMVPEKYMDKVAQFENSSKLDTIVFVLFLIPGLPKDVFTYLVPLTSMPIGKFLLLSNVGRIPGIVVSTYAASGLVEGRIMESIIIFVVAALIAGVGLIVYSMVMKRLDAKKAAGESDEHAHAADEGGKPTGSSEDGEADHDGAAGRDVDDGDSGSDDPGSADGDADGSR